VSPLRTFLADRWDDLRFWWIDWGAAIALTAVAVVFVFGATLILAVICAMAFGPPPAWVSWGGAGLGLLALIVQLADNRRLRRKLKAREPVQ
jgi:hypothetical protein